MQPCFSCPFHPVIKIEEDYQILDFTNYTSTMQTPTHRITIGRYNEKRPFLYRHDMFSDERHFHIGIDLGAPAGTPVHAFYDGEIYMLANHGKAGDYGPTIITRHKPEGIELFALHGHLSQESLNSKYVGQKIQQGEIFAYIGSANENGGWPPHVHFQLSYQAPKTPDMPGVVSEKDLEKALALYPDPRIVLGPLY